MSAPSSAELQTATLPRLLTGISASGALSLDRHLAIHGQLPRKAEGGHREDSRCRLDLIDEIELSGLRGRGGAGFPTATKLRAVANVRGKSIVVINGAEGEPASRKDCTLLESTPHLVLDGGAFAAQAIGADELLLCVNESATGALYSSSQAIEERVGLRGDPRKVRVLTVPDRYVAGQESALVNHLSGRPAKPTFTPPTVFERGVNRRPTLVNNPETLAHLALIARHGPQWFRELGTSSDPGSALITLLGPVRHEGVYEIEPGASLTSLIAAAGGLTAAIRAVLLGGYAGSWIDSEHVESLSLCSDELEPYGTSLGAGVVVLLEQDRCPVAEVLSVTRWLADESAGQCGPCVHGLDAMASTLEALASGSGGSDLFRRIGGLTSLVRRRGACSHPDGTARFVASALEVFEHEFFWHAENGPCLACRRPRQLPLPITTRTRAPAKVRR